MAQERLGDAMKDILTRISTQRANTHTSSNVGGARASFPASTVVRQQPTPPLPPSTDAATASTAVPPNNTAREAASLLRRPRMIGLPAQPAEGETAQRLAPPPRPQAATTAAIDEQDAQLPHASEENGELVLPSRMSGRRAPQICPDCKGAGWLRMNAPVGSPNFGRIIPCACKTKENETRMRRNLSDISNIDAFSNLNFTNFDTNIPGVREAFSVAREFARHTTGWLLLVGGYGCGKTHLAAAIANEALANDINVYFAVAPDLLDQLRAAYAPSSESSFDERFEQIRRAALLVLDDLGTENATQWAREKLYQIFNYRYNYHMPTVVTSNVDLDLIEPRIRSRLCDASLCRQIFIKAEDYRLRPDNYRRLCLEQPYVACGASD